VDALEQLEEETGQHVYTILQLRVHPSLIELRQRLDADSSGIRHQVVLTYVTSRGPWYLQSWKGQTEKSGGLATNIGIHFFDMLLWLFGQVEHKEVHHDTPMKTGGGSGIINPAI